MSSPNNSTVPSCASHVGSGQYSVTAQTKYDPISWPYYKTYVISAQVLPGLIIGALCWIGALVFIVWLLTLCCRAVRWRTSTSKTNEIEEPGRDKWAAFHLVLTVVVLGVIGAGTWALVDGIKATDGQVNEVWDLLDTVRVKLLGLDARVQSTSTSLGSLGSSVEASYNLIDSNQAVATAAGINVPDTLSILQTLSGQISSGQEGTEAAQENVQDLGITNIDKLESNYKKKTLDAWKTYRVIAVAVFFGLLIFFGIITGFLAVLGRTPRLTSLFVILLLIWTGLVLLFGAGALNVVWRVTRDTCLYGIDFAAEKLGGGGSTSVVLDYYFQKSYIAPQDVSQELFKFNLTSTIVTLNDSTINTLLEELNTTQGQAFVATASPSDQDSINALSPRLNLLAGNLNALNNEILASNFAPITDGILHLICCSITNGLWRLWLASIITGALSGLLAVLAIVKIVSAIQPRDDDAHYTPRSPNHVPHGTAGAMKGNPV